MSGYALILYLLHLVLSLIDLIHYLWRQTKRRITRFIISPLSYGSYNGYSSRTIQKLGCELTKLPLHLALVVVEEDLSIVDIARMIVWSAALRIEHLTVYDHKGRCKRMHRDICDAVEEQRHLYLSQSLPGGMTYNQQHMSINIVPHSRAPPISDGEKVTTHVRVVGPDDGRQRIVNVTKKLAVDVTNHRLAQADINLEKMESSMREEGGGWCDPDLIIRCGSVCSLLGFMPWETRLSEIMSISSHIDADVCEFGSALRAFCRTEQRLGK